MQSFPNKPIRLVTGAAAGGSADLALRLIADGISNGFGQPAIVDNLGTGEVASAEAVAKSAPNGYTLLFGAAGLWTTSLLQKTTFDLMRDFVPVILAVTQPHVLVVPPSLPVDSVADLIALARSRPGQLRYGSGLSGTPSHLAGALFTSMAAVDMQHVPYKNTAELGVNDLVAGKVQMIIMSAGTGIPHIKSGKLRGLGVTGTSPCACLPWLPAVAATLPGYEALQPLGVFAPAKTPEAVVKRLNQEMVKALASEKARHQLLGAGMEAVGSTPEEFADFIKSDLKRIHEVIIDAGIHTHATTAN